MHYESTDPRWKLVRVEKQIRHWFEEMIKGFLFTRYENISAFSVLNCLSDHLISSLQSENKVTGDLACWCIIRYINCVMSTNQVWIADPSHHGMLDITGFDGNVSWYGNLWTFSIRYFILQSPLHSNFPFFLWPSKRISTLSSTSPRLLLFYWLQ